MATWQYDLNLISSSDINNNEINEDTFDNLKGWNKDSVYQKIINLLSRDMKQSESWSEDVDIWGEEDKTCFKLFFDSGNITEINIRIDLRATQKRYVVNNIIELCEILDAKIVNSELNIIPLNKNDIIKDIKESGAYKFVSNPMEFLDSLK